MAYTLTIDGVTRQMQTNWELRRTRNGRGTFDFTIYSSDGSYRPSLDDEVVLMQDATTLFGGFIESLDEAGANGPITPIKTKCLARDYNTLARRRYVAGALAPGTLKSMLTTLVAYLPTGVILDPAQVTGPTLEEQAVMWITIEAALNQLSAASGGYIWAIVPGAGSPNVKYLRMYLPSAITAPFGITVANRKAKGDIEVSPTRQGYANYIFVRTSTYAKTAAPSPPMEEPWEALYTVPDDTTEDAAQALANEILAASLATLKRVKFEVLDAGLEPGQVMSIVNAPRNLNNSFLIEEIVSRSKLGNTGTVMHQVTAIEGTTPRPDFRDTYRQWAADGTGIAVGAVAAGGGSSSAQRYAYFLGGNENGVRSSGSPSPTWIAASGRGVPEHGAFQVQIDTVARGNTSATVRARLRAFDAGVTVQARLWDVSAHASCGSSGVVTNTDWEWVNFSVTLAGGVSHIYELQVLPSTADADVAAVGYVE